MPLHLAPTQSLTPYIHSVDPSATAKIMQYLARVQHNSAPGINLQLLARHISENTWVVDDVSRSVDLSNGQIPETLTPQVDCFVVVDLDEKDFPQGIEDVTDRLLELVQPWLAKEKEKIEQWRHECTLRSQELSIRELEVVSREAELDLRKEKLDLREQELDG